MTDGLRQARASLPAPKRSASGSRRTRKPQTARSLEGSSAASARGPRCRPSTADRARRSRQCGPGSRRPSSTAAAHPAPQALRKTPRRSERRRGRAVGASHRPGLLPGCCTIARAGKCPVKASQKADPAKVQTGRGPARSQRGTRQGYARGGLNRFERVSKIRVIGLP